MTRAILSCLDSYGPFTHVTVWAESAHSSHSFGRGQHTSFLCARCSRPPQLRASPSWSTAGVWAGPLQHRGRVRAPPAHPHAPAPGAPLWFEAQSPLCPQRAASTHPYMARPSQLRGMLFTFSTQTLLVYFNAAPAYLFEVHSQHKSTACSQHAPLCGTWPGAAVASGCPGPMTGVGEGGGLMRSPPEVHLRVSAVSGATARARCMCQLLVSQIGAARTRGAPTGVLFGRRHHDRICADWLQ